MDLKLSVFQIRGMAEDEIWNLGERTVVRSSVRTLYGRADIHVAAVRETGLEVHPDNNPQRHANVINWPMEKSKRKLLALQLAERANLKLHPRTFETE
jgi:hypothetical protein